MSHSYTVWRVNRVQKTGDTARKPQGNVGYRLRVVYVSTTCRLRLVYVSFTCFTAKMQLIFGKERGKNEGDG